MLMLSKEDLEKCRYELNQILVSQLPSTGIKKIMNKKLWSSFLLKELVTCMGFCQNNPYHDKDVFNHIMCVLDYTEPNLALRLAALFHDIGKPVTYSEDEKGIGHFYLHHKVSAKIARDIMTRLHYSSDLTEYVGELVYWHMSRHSSLKSKTIKRFIQHVGREKLDDLFKLQMADIRGSRPPFDYEPVHQLKLKCEEIIKGLSALSIKDLTINGHDLMELGYRGADIGKCLSYLLSRVIEDGNLNNKDTLSSLAIDYRKIKFT